MKKLIVFALLWVLALMAPIAAICQTAAPILPEAGINLQVYFVTLGAFAAIILPVTSFITRVFNIEIKWLKQILSWIVAFGVGILAYLFQWGIFIGVPWYHAILYCISAALVANGIFNIEVVKSILKLVGLKSKAIV